MTIFEERRSEPAMVEALLRSIGLVTEGEVSIVPLSGGITNRNYRVDAGGERYVVRIGGENAGLLGIDRTREHGCAVTAAHLGIAPEVVAFLPEADVLVSRFAGGRVLTPPDARDAETLGRVAVALRRLHDGPRIPGRFSAFATVRDYHARASALGVRFPGSMDAALTQLAAVEEGLRGDDPPSPCHNDLLPANLIDSGSAVSIIDWEYAAMGDRFFDLGNFAVNHELDAEGERRLLDVYFGEARPDDLRRLRLMRIASDMREALWGYLQSAISSLDVDFLGYGETHLERAYAAMTAGGRQA